MTIPPIGGSARCDAARGIALMLGWWRRRKEAARVASDDADSLIQSFGNSAYEEARERAREARRHNGMSMGRSADHWQRVRLLIAKRTGRAVGLDTATRMAQDAFRGSTRDDNVSSDDEATRALLGD